MIREQVEVALRDAHLDGGYHFPAYGDYCFAGVPATVGDLHGVYLGRPLPGDVFDGVDADVEHVVVVLVDGFGLDCWKRDRTASPLLDRLSERGTVTPLTSIFPSETAAAITTFHTGRLPAEHGVIGWDVYVPEADGVVEVLPYRAKGGGDPGEAFGVAFSPADLFDGDSVYARLADAGIESHVVQPGPTLDGVYADRTVVGAEPTPYGNVAEMALRVRQRLEAAAGPSYVYAYAPNVDAVSHEYGTDSDEYRAQVGAICDALERELLDRLDPDVAAETLLLVTADHGEVDTVPAESVDLLASDVVAESLRRTADGGRVPPVGGPRQAHLHLQPDTVETVREHLGDALDALVLTREETLARDLFGDRPATDRLRRRVGDLVVVHRNRTAWYDDGGDALHYVGQHGGLTPEEMLVPFAAANLADLQ